MVTIIAVIIIIIIIIIIIVIIIIIKIIVIIIIIIGPCLPGDKIDPLDQKYLQSNYSLGQNILEPYNVLVHIRLTISKVKRYI